MVFSANLINHQLSVQREKDKKPREGGWKENGESDISYTNPLVIFAVIFCNFKK